MNFGTKLVAFGAYLTMAGCSVLAPQPDHSAFFILTPVSENSGTAVTTSSINAKPQLTIGVGPLTFPDYLKRLPVVTRVGPNRIELSDDKRWAEPLDKNFTRVLSENLTTLLKTPRIETYPWPVSTQVDYQIEINVQRFEATSTGQAELLANWIVRDGQTHTILYASKMATSTPAGDDQASASSALSNGLATLSRQIASTVMELNHHRNNLEPNSASAS